MYICISVRRDKIKENEGKMGVVNLHRKEGGHFQPELGGQYRRILHSWGPEEVTKQVTPPGGWFNPKLSD